MAAIRLLQGRIPLRVGVGDAVAGRPAGLQHMHVFAVVHVVTDVGIFDENRHAGDGPVVQRVHGALGLCNPPVADLYLGLSIGRKAAERRVAVVLQHDKLAFRRNPERGVYRRVDALAYPPPVALGLLHDVEVTFVQAVPVRVRPPVGNVGLDFPAQKPRKLPVVIAEQVGPLHEDIAPPAMVCKAHPLIRRSRRAGSGTEEKHCDVDERSMPFHTPLNPSGQKRL